MLVIRRKVGESVVIGNRIRVHVLEVKGGVAKLGFEAPSDVSVHRSEVFTEIEEANRAAAEGQPSAELLQELARQKAPDDAAS